MTAATGGASWTVAADRPRWIAENSENCGGPNPDRQTGLARRDFYSPVPCTLSLSLVGNVERQDQDFDFGTILIDGEQVLQLHGLQEGLGCSMQIVAGGLQVELSAGSHSIELECDTVDGRYHVGCFYELDAVIAPWALGCSCCGAAVEWVRSCKSSKWRLHRGSDLLTDGRYVFCPDGAPHCPRWHHLGSRDWTSDERDPQPPLGEWEGSTSWNNGAFEAPYPDFKPIGNADCLQNGEAAQVVELVQYTRGFPLPCFDHIPTFPDTGSRSFKTLIAEALLLHYDGDPAAATKLQQATGFTSAVVDYPTAAGFPPGGMIQVTPVGAFVCIDGTSDPQTFALQAAATLTGPTNIGLYSTYPPWEASRLAWHLRLNANGVDPTGKIYLCGHSMGGVVCTLLAAVYSTWNPDRFVALQTFGSPCPGDQRVADMLRGVFAEQLVNDGDLVAAFASIWALGYPLVWAVTPLAMLVWPQWKQPGGRVVLAVDGTIDTTRDTWYGMVDLLNAADALAHGNPVALCDAHRMVTYVERLQRPGG